jgi:hypothetical protein
MRVICVLVLLVTLCVSVALAQETTPPAAGAAAAAAPAKPAARPTFMPGAGYLKVGPEAEALWKQLGQAEVDLHQKAWELFTLQSAAQVDRQAVKAKLGETRDLMKQMRDVRDKLKTYWVPQEMAKGAGHKGGGKPHGDKGKGHPAPPAAPPAAPAAPAAAGGA